MPGRVRTGTAASSTGTGTGLVPAASTGTGLVPAASTGTGIGLVQLLDWYRGHCYWLYWLWTGAGLVPIPGSSPDWPAAVFPSSAEQGAGVYRSVRCCWHIVALVRLLMWLAIAADANEPLNVCKQRVLLGKQVDLTSWLHVRAPCFFASMR